jgi:hypothetical protein
MVVEEGVPCYKGWEDNYLVLRVPFRKNGSGLHLNQYTVSMYVKVRAVAMDGSDTTGLVASQGWDQFSKPKDGEKAEDALVYMKPTGGVGALGSFGDGQSFVKDNTWHTIQVSAVTPEPPSRNTQHPTLTPTRNPQPSALNPQPATLNPQPSTRDLNPQHAP